MSKIKVKFLQTRVVQDERAGTSDEEKYEKGRTYELEPASANHWIRRGAAEPVTAAKLRKAKQPKAEGNNGNGEGSGEGGNAGNGSGEGGGGEGAGQTETT